MRLADPPALTPDCGSCTALCCVALPFDKGAGFAADKPAGTPCANLTTPLTCRIHADLPARGYPACAAFDCYGAGQRVVQQLFDGQTWRENPALLAPMSEAFLLMRRLHEALMLLDRAAVLPLDAKQEAQRQTLIDSLALPDNSALGAVVTARIAPVHRWLSGLRSALPASAREALAAAPPRP